MGTADEQSSISVFVWTCDGAARAYGVVETVTSREALMVLSEALKTGDVFQFLVLNHTDRTALERFGMITSTRHALNPDEALRAECKVKWVSASEAVRVSEDAHETSPDLSWLLPHPAPS